MLTVAGGQCVAWKENWGKWKVEIRIHASDVPLFRYSEISIELFKYRI